MRQLGSLNCTDLGEMCGVYVGARIDKGIVAFTVSLELNGDVEIVVTSTQARAIAALLVNSAKAAEDHS